MTAAQAKSLKDNYHNLSSDSDDDDNDEDDDDDFKRLWNISVWNLS